MLWRSIQWLANRDRIAAFSWRSEAATCSTFPSFHSRDGVDPSGNPVSRAPAASPREPPQREIERREESLKRHAGGRAVKNSDRSGTPSCSTEIPPAKAELTTGRRRGVVAPKGRKESERPERSGLDGQGSALRKRPGKKSSQLSRKMRDRMSVFKRSRSGYPLGASSSMMAPISAMSPTLGFRPVP